jgi:hypothetical protein
MKPLISAQLILIRSSSIIMDWLLRSTLISHHRFADMRMFWFIGFLLQQLTLSHSQIS